MTIPQFKRIARLLKESYKELEKEAISSGTDIFSEEYKQAQDILREQILERMGFTIEEYRTAKEQYLTLKTANLDEISKAKIAELLETHIPTEEEITEIAKSNIPAPQVTNITTNKIVKETTKVVEKPIKETIHETYKEEYDPSALLAEIGYLNDRLDKIKVPTDEELEEKIKTTAGASLKKNIDLLGMPNFRKLGMGLQSQIDQLRADFTSEEAGDVDSVNGLTGAVPLTGTTNQISISAANVFSIPSSAQLSVAKLTNLTSNGFVKTSGGDGTLSIDTNTYLTTASAASTYQPLDATLTAFAALTIAADSLTIGTGADAFSQTTFAANTFPAKASTGSLVAKTITDFGLSLVDDADASTARTTLGLGTAAVVNTDLSDLNEATIEAAIDTLANLTSAASLATVGTITSGVWNGTTIAIANGGTGQTTALNAFNAFSGMTALGQMIYGGGSGSRTILAGSTSTQKRFLTQTGDGVNSSAPVWSTVDVGNINLLGANVATALAVAVGSAGAFVVNGGALGTPSSGTVTNLTGTAGINITGTAPAGTLTGTTLASNVVTSSLTTLGTLTSLTINSATVTLDQDTNFVTSGGVNGMSIDGTTFSVDGTNNRIGIGTAAPATTLHINNTLAVQTALRLGNGASDGDYSDIQFYGNNNDSTYSIGIFRAFQLSSGSAVEVARVNFAHPGTGTDNLCYLNFFTHDGTSNIERLRLSEVGNLGLKTTVFGTSGVGVFGIGNGTEPSTSPADMVQLYSVDLSAGNATLGIRTETAVVTESVTSDRTLSVKINGTVYKICLKA